MVEEARCIGILAGGGSLPREIAESALSRGARVHIVAIDGEADADFGQFPVTRVNWGQIGGMIRALKANHTDALVIVGRVHRPELWGLKTDLGFFLNLPAIVKIVASGGDDSVLRRVVRFFEKHGLRVIGPADAAPEIVIGEGPLAIRSAGDGDVKDIETGFDIVRRLGPFDVGQGVVVTGGVIEAIEGVEGTDRMLERVAARRASNAERQHGGVLVKRSKPGQDMRVDMPAIGPATAGRAAMTGLAGVAVEAGRVLAVDRAEAIRRADREGIFIVGVRDTRSAESPPHFDPARSTTRARLLSRGTLARHHEADAAKGAAVVAALHGTGVGRAVVVVRNHVLAVEAGEEGALAVIRRAAELRQWASLTRRRRGIAVLAEAKDLSPDVVAAVEAAGYAGAAIAAPAAPSEIAPDVRRAIEAAGLVLLAVEQK